MPLAGAVLACVAIAAAAVLLRTGSARPRVFPGSTPDPSFWPRIDVVVPVWNEAGFIREKIENLLALDYPADRIAFRIVDGASDDGTPERAAAAAAGDPRFDLGNAGIADKTVQLNFALRRCDAEWVLVTDADARLGSDTVKRLVRNALSGGAAGAVGATVTPSPAHPWESLHWRLADRRRLREGAAGAASIVTGPCYLFRRALIDRLPDDVIADDVHVPLRAACAGMRTGFVEADVVELRAPTSLAELVPHKYRKANAYLREIFRFLPRAAGMPPEARATFLRQAAIVLLAPAAEAAAVAAVVAGAARNLVVAAAALAAAMVVLAVPGLRRRAGLILLLGAVLAAGIPSAVLVGRGAGLRKPDRRRRPTPEPHTP